MSQALVMEAEAALWGMRGRGDRLAFGKQGRKSSWSLRRRRLREKGPA